MKAIVYTSQTGHTQRYAQMLAERTGRAGIQPEGGRKELAAGRGDLLHGLADGRHGEGPPERHGPLYHPGGSHCGGLASGERRPLDRGPDQRGIQRQRRRLFYLQGGYAPEKLGFFYRMMMKPMAGSVVRQVQARGEAATDQERRMAEIFQHGGDFVREEALDEIVRWFREGPHDGEVKAVPSVDI